jgi:rhodanese-related sulfurtransferase
MLWAQNNIDEAIKKYNTNSITYIYPESLNKSKNAIILDSREKEEYNVSHLKNAIWVGYNNFDIKKIKLDKNSEIVIYCSIGVRSEDIGEQLINNGYTNVKNLYGGIFKWVENDFPVYDITNHKTKKVHVYNKKWGELFKKGEKIY